MKVIQKDGLACLEKKTLMELSGKDDPAYFNALSRIHGIEGIKSGSMTYYTLPEVMELLFRAGVGRDTVAQVAVQMCQSAISAEAIASLLNDRIEHMDRILLGTMEPVPDGSSGKEPACASPKEGKQKTNKHEKTNAEKAAVMAILPLAYVREYTSKYASRFSESATTRGENMEYTDADIEELKKIRKEEGPYTFQEVADMTANSDKPLKSNFSVRSWAHTEGAQYIVKTYNSMNRTLSMLTKEGAEQFLKQKGYTSNSLFGQQSFL